LGIGKGGQEVPEEEISGAAATAEAGASLARAEAKAESAMAIGERGWVAEEKAAG